MVNKIAENFNRLSRVHQRHRQTDDRQTTGGIAMAYSERERKFTSAKKSKVANLHNSLQSQTEISGYLSAFLAHVKHL